MGIPSRGGSFLTKLGKLLSSCTCCSQWWCIPDRTDACGAMRYSSCDSTKNPPADAKGPLKQSECPQCSDTNNCDAYWCYPSGSTYECRPDPFGDGAASGPYFSDITCQGCNSTPYPADKYYCCYDYVPSASGKDTPKKCQQGMCKDPNGSVNRQLLASGPHDTPEACAAQCSRYDCNSSQGCVTSTNGKYATLDDCQTTCGCKNGTADTCSATPISVSGNSGYSSRQFSVPSGVLTVTVDYDAYSVPDRFQIWGPSVDPNGNQIASRVIKRDSGYRGDAGYCVTPVGTGKGTLVWDKPAGITCFEVAVIAPCASTGWIYRVSCGVNNAP